MPLPRVEKLRYEAKSDGAIIYRHVEIDTDAINFMRNVGPAQSAVGETEEFRVTVSDGLATVEMIADFGTVDEARAIVEPYLRAWEIKAFIRHFERHSDWQHPLLFKFVGAEVSNSVPTDAVGIIGSPAGGFFAKQYSPAPIDFVASDKVQAMWARWQGYRADKEPLQSMAYYCSTAVTAAFGNDQAAAAQQLRISRQIFSSLNRLTSEVGTDRDRRKAVSTPARELTAEERQWIQECVILLVLRMGEYDSVAESRRRLLNCLE